MLIQLLLGWVAEAVFGSSAALGREFERELDGYLKQQGYDASRDKRRVTAA
jgi:hypothetical protein